VDENPEWPGISMSKWAARREDLVAWKMLVALEDEIPQCGMVR
jgi:hypothetical protein